MGMVPTTQAAAQLPPSVSYSPAYPLPAAGAMPPPSHSIVQTQTQSHQPAESAQSESSYESSSEEEGQEGQGDEGQDAKAESEGASPAEDAEEPNVATVPSVPSSVSLPPPSMPASVPPSIPASMPVSEQKPMSEDVNLQTRLSNSKEALKLPLGAKPADERLDKFLFGHGYAIAREVPPPKASLPAGALGKGAFGVVYRGSRRRDNAEVALKVSENASSAEPMLEQEINILKLLDHPSIVRFMEAFVDRSSDSMVIAMELVTGGDLLSSLTGEPQHYEESLVRPMIFHIACALAHAHEMGVVHRDLKPENILLRQGDRFPKVADFGLSRSLRNSEMAMTVAGTPTYMAPEIQDPRLPYDFPADIYSLGCILTDLMDKSFCCSWYAKATPGTHEKMRKRWPDGATHPKFSAPLKELQGSMIGQAPGLRPTCYQVCNDLLTLADTQPLPHVLWQEKTKLPKGAPTQKMLGSELAREIAGRGGYAIGCRVRVLVDGGWHPGEVKHISTSMCPGAVQVHFRRGGDAKGEEAILVCPWQFQQLLRPDPGAVTKEERMGTLIFPEQAPPKTSPSKGSRTPASTPARKEVPVAKQKCQPGCRQQ